MKEKQSWFKNMKRIGLIMLFTAGITSVASAQAAFVSEQAAMYVGGTFNGWDIASTPMTLIADNTWKLSEVTLPVGDYEFKFANSSDWSGDDWGNASGLSGTTVLTSGGGKNITFTIATADTYNFTFNDLSLEYSITSSSVTSIKSVESAKSIAISQNSTSGTITLNCENGEIHNVKIIDLSGKCLYETSALTASATLDLGHFANGVYVIVVQTDKEVMQTKIIKK